jgi:hypothetical protein
MPEYRESVTTCPVDLPRPALAGMIRLVRTLFRLSRNPAYRARVLSQVPETARFDPGHNAVMMGYDFHLENDRPRLIEVNTNAGGGLLAYLAHFPSSGMARAALPERLRREFLAAFAEEMTPFKGAAVRPEHIAIVDEDPEKQFLYGEMVAFKEMFQDWGTAVTIADPSHLQASPEGIWVQGRRVDLIYNRHCDFYLEGEALAGIRAAYLAGAVCLTPNPFTYGLLADKRRLPLWSDAEWLNSLGLSEKEITLLRQSVPESRLLADLDPVILWNDRAHWVFKPVSRFGSRGVLLGGKISRARFETLNPEDTLVQRFVAPSVTSLSPDCPPMKTDFRLFVYSTRVLGVTARLYQGQVTNMRTPGGGFAPVRLVKGGSRANPC